MQLVSADIVAPRGNAPYVCAGAEYTAYNEGGNRVLLRLGASSLTLGDISGLNGVSAGLGAEVPMCCVSIPRSER